MGCPQGRSRLCSSTASACRTMSLGGITRLFQQARVYCHGHKRLWIQVHRFKVQRPRVHLDSAPASEPPVQGSCSSAQLLSQQSSESRRDSLANLPVSCVGLCGFVSFHSWQIVPVVACRWKPTFIGLRHFRSCGEDTCTLFARLLCY